MTDIVIPDERYRVVAQCAGLQSTDQVRWAQSPTVAARQIAESYFRGAGATVVSPGYLYTAQSWGTEVSVWAYTAYGPNRRRDAISIRIYDASK